MRLNPKKLLPYADYLWWESPQEAVKRPIRLLAQIMELGDYKDIQALTDSIGEEPFKAVLANPPVGVFSVKSWYFWHYRLGIVTFPGDMPPLPQRTFV